MRAGHTVAIVAALLVGSPALAARQEVASFRSEPGSARVFIDGAYVGDTPLELTFQCDQIGDRRYRIERDGCAPVEGILNARVAPGRIVGASFCFGINYAFQCTQYFVPVSVMLDCRPADDAAAPPAAGATLVGVDQLPPRVDLRKQPSPTALSTEEMQTQLKSLKDLRQRGVISEEQYEQERERLLNALGY